MTTNIKSDYEVVQERKADCDVCGTSFMFGETYVNPKGIIWRVVPDGEKGSVICKNKLCTTIAENIKEIRSLNRELQFQKEINKMETDNLAYVLSWHKKMIIALPFVFVIINTTILMILHYIY